MINALRILIAGILLTCTGVALSQSEAGYSEGGTEQCVTCHDFGPESPVHAVMAGPHGATGDAETMKDRHGCEDCHGASASHTSSPTQVAPGVSFGPRWSASSAAQDGTCLACHEENVAKHWKDALHMVNSLTCVTCHDIHTEADQVLLPRKQAQVCTVCHESQKQGVHGLQKIVKRNPNCSTCHNPHDHESAKTEMLNNRSQGCRSCHNLVKMSDSAKVSDRAKSYHKIMVSSERTCIECHSGIAHAPMGSVTSFSSQPGKGTSGKHSGSKVEVAPK